MAHDIETFTALRDSLRGSLRDKSFVPELEGEESIKDRFFPAGTARNVLIPKELHRLFTFVVNGTPEHGLQPERLAEKARDEKFCTFLAILIVSKCDLEAFISFTLKALFPDKPVYELPPLPIEDCGVLSDILNSQFAAEDFYEHQYSFFAPILEKYKEIKSDFKRLPYLEQTLIGQGSFGKIYKVKISPGHYRYNASFTNDVPLPLARKDFVLDAKDKAHEKERDVIREIVGNAKKHDSIIRTWGSLQVGSTYSLFMDLAECDLRQYMIDNPDAPGSVQAKVDLLHCAVGLAGAIAFLHDDLESSTFETLSCFHMDLKPQNILVVRDAHGKAQWKLSDFNMSRVKRVGVNERANEHFTLKRRGTLDQILDINKLFKRTVPDDAGASSAAYTRNQRGYGTYLAPEACVGDPVYAQGDTWSLGCVVIVVFSYLYEGQPAVTRLHNLRATQDFDAFFTFTNTKSQPKLSDAQPSHAVKIWLHELRNKTARRNAEEGAIFDKMLNFIEKEVLIIDPKSRKKTAARDIKTQLLDACNTYRAIEHNRVESPKTPKTPTSRWRLSSIFSPKQPPLQSDPVHSTWNLPSLSDSWKNCVFGPGAEPLICATDRTLTVYSLGHALLTGNVKDLIKYGEAVPSDTKRLWSENLAAAAQLVIAATNHSEFECYIYQISQPDSAMSELKLVAHWELDLPRIRRLAISPDARFAAFVLESSSASPTETPMHIVSLSRLQVGADDQRLPSMVSTSSGSSSTSSTVVGRPLSLPCSAEDVRELSFSAANGLYAVVKPTYAKPNEEYAMKIFSWDLNSGQAKSLSNSRIVHDGKDDLLHRLFTSFAPYNKELAFAVVSQEKRVVLRSWKDNPYRQSRIQSCRLLKILVDGNDRQIVAIGTKQANDELHIFAFSTATVREDFKPEKVASLPGMKHGSRFAAVLATEATQLPERRFVLVSSVEGNLIRLVRTYLDTP